jgi:paired amphipathic helix protein Sin3a
VAKVLWDERRLESPTVEDHRRFRREAEEILGPEDNLFRIDWVNDDTFFRAISLEG